MSNIKDYIFEHLDNLGELERPEFNYLSNNVEEFYSESSEHNSLILNEKAFLQLSHLFKIISFEDFPKEFDLTEVKIKYVNGKICLINKFNQLCYEEDGQLYITPILSKIDTENYYNISKQIKNSLKDNFKWKQKLYSVEYYDKYNIDTYSNDENCTVALKDIQTVSVLKANGIDNIKEIDLILQTVEIGGRLTESYAEDFNKYVNYGFIPVSICKWEDSRAPKSWVSINQLPKDYTLWKNIPEDIFKIKRQDIIFYIYTGTKINKSFNDWIRDNEYSDSYESAKEKQLSLYYDNKEKLEKYLEEHKRWIGI